MVPDTSKIQILGPDASAQFRKEPAPLSFRLVTRIILPPRPAGVFIPKPAEPGMTGSSARTFEQINVAAKNAAARHLIVFSIFHTPRGYEMAAIPLDFDLPVTKKWLHLCRKLRTRLSATEWLRPMWRSRGGHVATPLS
jgi:hypothetical protein